MPQSRKFLFKFSTNRRTAGRRLNTCLVCTYSCNKYVRGTWVYTSKYILVPGSNRREPVNTSVAISDGDRGVARHARDIPVIYAIPRYILKTLALGTYCCCCFQTMPRSVSGSIPPNKSVLRYVLQGRGLPCGLHDVLRVFQHSVPAVFADVARPSVAGKVHRHNLEALLHVRRYIQPAVVAAFKITFFQSTAECYICMICDTGICRYIGKAHAAVAVGQGWGSRDASWSICRAYRTVSYVQRARCRLLHLPAPNSTRIRAYMYILLTNESLLYWLWSTQATNLPWPGQGLAARRTLSCRGTHGSRALFGQTTVLPMPALAQGKT